MQERPRLVASFFERLEVIEGARGHEARSAIEPIRQYVLLATARRRTNAKSGGLAIPDNLAGGPGGNVRERCDERPC
jgi:hypothetical protein